MNSLAVISVALSIPQCNTDNGLLQLQHSEVKQTITLTVTKCKMLYIEVI